MSKYLNEAVKKDKELFEVMVENTAIKEILIENIPLLLLKNQENVGSNRLKNIIFSVEEVHLNSLDSLSGPVTYSYAEEMLGSSKYIPEFILEGLEPKVTNHKPEWLEKLEYKCIIEPDKLHALVFSVLEKASTSIKKQLNDIIETRTVDGIWSLPNNARIVLISDDEKTNNQDLEELSKKVATIKINTTPEAWLKLINLTDLPNGIENQNSEIVFDSHLLAYVLYKFWKVGEKEDVLGIYNNPNKLCVISRLRTEYPIKEVLKLFISEKNIEEFLSFCNKNSRSVKDVISGEYFKKSEIRDFAMDILMYLRICAHDNEQEKNIAMNLFEEYDDMNGAFLSNIRSWVASNDELKLKYFMELVNQNYSSVLLRKNTSIRRIRINNKN